MALVVTLIVLVVATAVLFVMALRLRQSTRRLAQALAAADAARDQAQMLLAVAEAVNSSLSLEEVIDVALDRCVRLVHAPAGAFFMARPGAVELTREAATGLTPHEGPARRPLAEAPLRQALLGTSPSVHPLPEGTAPRLSHGGVPAHVLVVPVRRGGRLLAAIEVYLTATPTLADGLRELLQGVAAETATAIRHAQIYREQEESSLTDELTRLPNRRYLGQRFLQERQRARRGHRWLGVLMLDIDHFKDINDVHGHLVGDSVLASLAVIVRNTIREADVAARYGGEEFAVIVHETNLDGAMRLAGRIRTAVEEAAFPNGLRLTVSIGVACTDDGERFDHLFELADAALYRAKASGRNRVEAAIATEVGVRAAAGPESGAPEVEPEAQAEPVQ